MLGRLVLLQAFLLFVPILCTTQLVLTLINIHAQAAQLMSLVDEADMGLNAHNNVGQRGVVHKGNTAVNSSRQSNRQSSRRHSPPRH